MSHTIDCGCRPILRHLAYVVPGAGNLTEEKSLCVPRGLRYGDFGSHLMWKIQYGKYCDMTPEGRNWVARGDVHC
jgi:hypothetical protein